MQNGGFGQFFHNWSDEAAAAAEDAYKRIARADLATLVAEARANAKGKERSDLVGHPAFTDLDSSFWNALKDDPTRARAAYVKKHVHEL